MRNFVIDATAGLMMLVIIMGHTLDWLGLCDTRFWQNILRCFFYFMPFFFFKSGMFFSDNCLKLGEVAKKQRWLLVSFFIFGIVSVIVVAMRMYVDDQFSFYSLFKRVIGALFVRGTFYGNSALWFLLTLFIVKLLYFYIHTKVSDYFIVIVTFFILLLNFGLKQQNATINFMLSIPDYLYNSISGLMFYALGHVFKKKQYSSKVFVFAFSIYVLLASFAFSYVDMYHNKVIEGYYFIWPLLALCGVVSINNFMKIMSKIYSFPILQFVGRNSFVFFSTHFIIGNLDYILFRQFGIIDTYQQLFVYLLSYIILLPLLSILFKTKHLRFLIGK